MGIEMKQRFLNDYHSIVVCAFLFIVDVALLVFLLSQTHNSAGRIACFSIFGTCAVLSVILCLLSFEIITVFGNSITSRKIYKKTAIEFSEIEDITVSKSPCVDGTVSNVWTIKSKSGKTIRFVKTKKREAVMQAIEAKSKLE